MDDIGEQELVRLPGLYRRWELAQILESGIDYRIEDAGETRDGAALLAVFAATPAREAETS